MAAIYMWPVEDQILLTTTLYPVEVSDSVALGAIFDTGRLDPIPATSIEHTYNLYAASYIQKRWFYYDGPYEASIEHTYDLFGASYIQKRWFYTDGPYEDSVEHTYDLYNATYVRKRVYADAPAELLQLGATFNTGTMTL